MNSRETFCSHCGASLENDFPDEHPCPHCGEVGRDVYLSGYDKIAFFDEIADLDIEHGAPLWEQRWRLLKHRLERLREGYSDAKPLSWAELEDAADGFYMASHSMFDWLYKDASLPGISKETVKRFVRSHPPLEICEGYAITSKHMAPDPKRSRMEARIKRYHSSAGRARLDIEYGPVNQPTQSIDALDLAEQCYDAWRTFLQQHGLPV